MASCLLESGARDGDGHEFQLPPYRLESGDEWCVLVGLLFEPLLTSEVLEKSDLDEDSVALLAVESAWVRRRGVLYPSGVDEVGAVQWKRASWVSGGSIYSGMRAGASMHSESPVGVGVSYPGSWDMSVRLRRGVWTSDGIGASQSVWA